MLTSCCFMRLRTAGLVIGGLQAVGSVLNVILNAIQLNDLNEAKRRGVLVLENANIVLIIVVVMSLVNLLTSILLIFGTIKNRHKLLLPWLIVGIISFIISVLYLCGMVYSAIAGASDAASFVVLIIVALALAFQFYCIQAIYSLYKEIQGNNNEMCHMPPPGSMQTHLSHI